MRVLQEDHPLNNFPPPEMLKRIAAGLDLDTPELFSVKSGYITETIKNYKKDVLKVISETTNSILDRKLEQLKKKYVLAY